MLFLQLDLCVLLHRNKESILSLGCGYKKVVQLQRGMEEITCMYRVMKSGEYFDVGSYPMIMLLIGIHYLCLHVPETFLKVCENFYGEFIRTPNLC